MAFTDTLKLLGAAGVIGFATFSAHALTSHHAKEVASKYCEPLEVSVYFQPGGTELNEFAERVLDNVMYEMRYCDLAKIEVDGFADASGAADLNLQISKARAESTLNYLKARGFEALAVELDAKGEEGAIDKDGRNVAMRRKADLRLIPVADAA